MNDPVQKGDSYNWERSQRHFKYKHIENKQIKKPNNSRENKISAGKKRRNHGKAHDLAVNSIYITIIM